MKFKGIIFDFNGTIILDDENHFKGWLRFCEDLGFPLTEEFYFNNMHGSTNELIYSLFYKKPCPPELVGKFGIEKEVYYREASKKDPPPYANGVLDLMRFLDEKGIPKAIATSSDIGNVDFFKTLYDLDSLVGENLIYNDGILRGKPHPDLFLRAAEKISVDPGDCIMVEDSVSGVRACRAAGAGLVVGICPRGAENFVGKEYTDMTITDFTELDYKNLFEY